MNNKPSVPEKEKEAEGGISQIDKLEVILSHLIRDVERFSKELKELTEEIKE